MNQTYLDTARLLTQVAPLVFVDDTFALKGGTAINLFVRDMPRPVVIREPMRRPGWDRHDHHDHHHHDDRRGGGHWR